MLKTICQTIEQHNMVQANESILVCLSGGADSIATLHALLTLKLNVFAVHINHGLRNEAYNDENFVKRLCENWQVPLQVYHINVHAKSKEDKITIEEAGRSLRYEHFYKAAKFFGAKKIATGHHQNDNAETVIMNLARGTGLRGLCGIPHVSGNIIRPLLDVPHSQIKNYIETNKLEYVTDASNFTNIYTRNRVRHMIMPSIVNEVNLNAVANIAKNATWLKHEESFINDMAEQAYLQVVQPVNDMGKVKLLIKELHLQHIAIQMRIVRKSIEQVGSLRNITNAHIQSILGLSKGISGKEVALPNIAAYREYENIVISNTQHNSWHAKNENGKCELYLDVSHSPPDKNRLLNPKNAIMLYTKPFNYDMVISDIVLRTRLPGDKITLNGNPPFTKKLQDYFTDSKTPKHDRDNIYLVASGSDILWVLDSKNPINSKYLVNEGTKNIVWVTVYKHSQYRSLKDYDSHAHSVF